MKDFMINLDSSPVEWTRVELGKICEVYGGIAAPKGDEPFQSGTVPFVRMQDLGRHHRSLNLIKTKDKLNRNFISKNNFKLIKKGSILIPRSGSVGLNHRAILGIDAYIVSHICALTVTDSSIHNKYLYYALCNYDMRRIMKKTTGLDALTFQDLKRIKIPKPPFEIQKKIVELLENLEKTKLFRVEADALTSSLSIAIFNDMFSNKSFPEKPLGELCNFIDYRGKTPTKTEQGIPLITAKNVKQGFLSRNPEEFIAEKDYDSWMRRGFPKEGDLLFTTEAPLGNVARLGKFDRIALAQRIITLQCTSDLNSYYLLHALLSAKIKKNIEKQATGSTATGIRASELKKIKIPVPSSEQQHKFANLIIKIEQLKEKQLQSRNQIDFLFNAAIQTIFNGGLS